MEIAVCVHLYHPDMWDKIESYLKNLHYQYKLYVTFPLDDENGNPIGFEWDVYLNLYSDLKEKITHKPEILLQHYLKYGKFENRFYRKDYYDVNQKIKKFKEDTKIIITKNIGMDIGGFLQNYKYIDTNVDLILKIHTKKSLGSFENKSFDVDRYGYDKAKKYGEKWFTELMDGVLGNHNKVDKIINEFKVNNKCGLVGYKKYNNHRKNGSYIKPLLNNYSININLDESYFVGGTIFWVRNDIMKKYLTNDKIDWILKLLLPNYSYEPSYAHAMERMFAYFVYNQQKEMVVIN
jgi:lipopolysaccharide biosynthesis protein